MTNGLLLEYKILKIVILNLVVAFSAYCQSEIIDLQATHSELSCGANFAYQSKIRIQNDTISVPAADDSNQNNAPDYHAHTTATTVPPLYSSFLFSSYYHHPYHYHYHPMQYCYSGYYHGLVVNPPTAPHVNSPLNSESRVETDVIDEVDGEELEPAPEPNTLPDNIQRYINTTLHLDFTTTPRKNVFYPWMRDIEMRKEKSCDDRFKSYLIGILKEFGYGKLSYHHQLELYTAVI